MQTCGDGAKLQAALTQSLLVLQILPTPQAPQVPPPQSMSVSLPSDVPSWHWSATQTWFVAWQNMWTQSRCPSVHLRPSAQPEQVPPPQSVSVSLPSLVPSMHCVATQV